MSGDLDRKGGGSDDHEDYLGEEESDATSDQVKKLVLNRPDVLAALQVQNMEVSSFIIFNFFLQITLYCIACVVLYRNWNFVRLNKWKMKFTYGLDLLILTSLI